MKNLKEYPLALQLLMQTDGTVTDLLKLLTNEAIVVNKCSENSLFIKRQKVLDRRIFLQGLNSRKKWMYAQSEIYLDRLTVDFVDDLMNKNKPIGALWMTYRVETFKELVSMTEQCSDGIVFSKGTLLLTRVYKVFNQSQLIMKIHEQFPIDPYVDMI